MMAYPSIVSKSPNLKDLFDWADKELRDNPEIFYGHNSYNTWAERAIMTANQSRLKMKTKSGRSWKPLAIRNHALTRYSRDIREWMQDNRGLDIEKITRDLSKKIKKSSVSEFSKKFSSLSLDQIEDLLLGEASLSLRQRSQLKKAEYLVLKDKIKEIKEDITLRDEELDFEIVEETVSDISSLPEEERASVVDEYSNRLKSRILRRRFEREGVPEERVADVVKGVREKLKEEMPRKEIVKEKKRIEIMDVAKRELSSEDYESFEQKYGGKEVDPRSRGGYLGGKKSALSRAAKKVEFY